jgi:hypothetical protein
MAEFYIRKSPSWMEYVPQAEKDKWSDDMWAKYNRRVLVNDICVVKPNGFKWADSEEANVISVPSLDYDDAKKLSQEDCELLILPEVKLGDFLTIEQILVLDPAARVTILTSKITDIDSLLIKDLTSLQNTSGDLNSEVLIKSRTALIQDSTHKIEFEVTMTDLSTVTISQKRKRNTYSIHRFKYEGGEVIDKYLDVAILGASK